MRPTTTGPNRMTRRRLALALLATLAVVAVFAVRLVDLQIVRADELNADSLDKRAIAVTTYAPRGDIVDRDGAVLAGSVMRYDITVSPKTVLAAFEVDGSDVVDTAALTREAARLGKVTGQTAPEVLAAFSTEPESDFEYVAKAVTTEQMRAVQKLDIPGVYPRQNPVRQYPGGSVAGNLTGFVGTDGPQEGLERSKDSCLASTDGTSTYEQGADGIRLPGSTVTTQPAVPGGTLMTTIDTDLQWAVDQMIAEQALAIGADEAMATVVDTRSSEILALSEWPAVDPNDVDGSPAGHYGSKAFSTPYEPGSIFKPMTAAMLLNEGKADARTRVENPYVWNAPNGARVRDATAHPDQRLTLAGVIQESSNVGISQLAERLPNDVRYDYMTRFGVGQYTGIDFSGESAGILDSTWNNQQQYDVSYGQGVSTTLAQIAGIYQTLGNEGVRIPLKLVTGCRHADGTVTDVPSGEGDRIVSAAATSEVLKMMEGVVTGGTLAKDLQIPGYRVAAKSGTAEVAENGRYTSDRIVSLAGVAPAEAPRYAVIVTYVKPDTIRTSAAAAPTFNKIMTHVLKTYRVTPSTTSSPVMPTTW